MALTTYNKKRNFKNTPEPKGRAISSKLSRFVVQRHDASRLHYDFRLEMDGVLKSWAVPKGPSLNPGDKRLAVLVEDHPVSYIDFEGEIPEGNYGAGSVEVWDNGTYYPVDKEGNKISEKEGLKALKNGDYKFFIKGKKLHGEFVLVRMKGGRFGSDKDDGKNWLLIKHKDEHAITTKYDIEKFRKSATKTRRKVSSK